MSYVVIARWTAQPGNEEGVRRALAALARPSRAEPGCRAYRVLRSNDDPRVFLIYEEYADEAAYEAHAASDHFRRHGLEEGIPLLETRERSYYTPIGELGPEVA
jgi:quinol monooxygenase YgiN